MKPNIVIATGGGIVTRAENLALLYKTFVVYLTADIDLLAERCSESQARPLLNQAVDQYKAISDIFYQREEAYKQAADCTIHMDGKKLYAIINEIKSYL